MENRDGRRLLGFSRDPDVYTAAFSHLKGKLEPKNPTIFNFSMTTIGCAFQPETTYFGEKTHDLARHLIWRYSSEKKPGDDVRIHIILQGDYIELCWLHKYAHIESAERREDSGGQKTLHIRISRYYNPQKTAMWLYESSGLHQGLLQIESWN